MIKRFAASALSALPSSQRLRVKYHGARVILGVRDRLRFTGELDYPHGRILMNVDSPQQVLRLVACAKEPETVQWIEDSIHSGDILYDIGANVGAYSFVAHVATGGNCTVYSFEPGFSTFAALCENVIVNGCEGKIMPIHVALSDETRLAMFHYSSLKPGAASHRLGSNDENGEDASGRDVAQPVLTFRLDDLVQQFGLRPPTHIKLDVDGVELSVLRGADKVLDAPSLRSILVEVDEEQYSSGEILACLEPKGFRVRSKHPRSYLGTLANYIFER